MRALHDGWQHALVAQLRALVEPDPDVQGLVVFGSSASADTMDRLSDVDVMLVVSDGGQSRFFPATGWLLAIGPIFAFEQSARERHGVHRVVFEDMRRLDVIVVEECVVADISNWTGHPLRAARQEIFSRSAIVDRVVATVLEPVPAGLPSPDETARRLSDFWFVAQLALHKAARGDLLIATHLHTRLVGHCLEWAMVLRDRAAGTRYHRRGEESDAATLWAVTSARIVDPLSAAAIIAGVEAACREFDGLMAAWDRAYVARTPAMQPLVDEVRAVVGAG